MDLPGLVSDIPAHGVGRLEPDDHESSFQPKPFYDSMNCVKFMEFYTMIAGNDFTGTIYKFSRTIS